MITKKTAAQGVTDPRTAINQNLSGFDDKDKRFVTQYQTVYQLFQQQPQTMLQVSIKSGILRANICRYIADMEQKGIIQIIKTGRCPLTKHSAGFYSTDKALFNKKIAQPSLFDTLWQE